MGGITMRRALRATALMVLFVWRSRLRNGRRSRSAKPGSTDPSPRNLGIAPCPYNRDSNGSRCAGRSSHSRPGGNAPLCFASDITDKMIAAHRKRNRS